jgi:hypothetical protein
VALALCPAAPAANAVGLSGNFSLTVAPTTAASYASYTFNSFRVQNKETVTGYTLTFPADTDASGATPGNPADTLTVAADNRTVTVVLGTPVAGPVSLPVTINNVRNPTTAGTYSIASVTFTRQGTTSQSVNISTTTYTIAPAPYISMTITTPDPGQIVDFGTIDPGVATAAKQVQVTVTSSAAYTITRSYGGSSAALGLVVTEGASGTQSAGTLSWTDDYTLTPPWTTDPEVILTATVTYTVTQ